VYISIRFNARVWMDVRVSICSYMYVYYCIRVRVRVYVRVYVCVYVRVYVCVLVCVYINGRVYLYMVCVLITGAWYEG
jgi:hypothetical protein